MIGKTPRVIAVKYARPTTPKTANTAKDTFSTVMPRVCRLSFGLMGMCFFIFQIGNITPVDVITPSDVMFRLHSITSTAAHKLVKTGEDW
jgi:hypothetical protein